MDVFKSKIDKPLLICLVFSVVASLLGVSVMIEEGGTLYSSLAVFTIIGGVCFPLWIFVSTKYAVTNESLEIKSGPFSWNIPIKSIKSVQETQNALTGPALSFDRLEITYDEDKVIYVSPVDKTAFMHKLGYEELKRSGKSSKQQTAGKTSKNNTQKEPKKQKSRQV